MSDDVNENDIEEPPKRNLPSKFQGYAAEDVVVVHDTSKPPKTEEDDQS